MPMLSAHTHTHTHTHVQGIKWEHRNLSKKSILNVGLGVFDSLIQLVNVRLLIIYLC